MMSVNENRLQKPRSVAVFRALVLGDLLCAIPAIRALREGCPDSKITLIGLPWAKNFARRFSHLIDDFLAFPGFPGLPESVPQIAEIPKFFQQAQQRQFDVSLQMHGSGSYVNSITALLGPKRMAGFYKPGEWCPDTECFMPFPKEDHEILKLLQLMEFLGLSARGTHLEFPILPQDLEDFKSIDGIGGLKEDYVCLHAGSRLMSRRWLPERFARTAEFLSALGFHIVLTGSVEEKHLADSVCAQARCPCLNWAGKTTLGALGVLLQHSRLLITNDTGISHLASALKVPSVVIVTGSDYRRWAPLEEGLHKAVYAPVDCRPCSYDICPIGQPCAHKVRVLDVVAAAQDLLSSHERSAICAV